MKNVIIYGGAFDPPHIGHINIVNHLLGSLYKFDEVWVVPCYKHTFGKDMTSGEHRLKMCKLVFNSPDVKVIPYEIENKISGQTYNVLGGLMNEYANEINFSMAIGQDNADNINRWYKHEEVIKMIPFVVFPREGYEEHSGGKWYLEEPHRLARTFKLNYLSSTMFRDAFKECKCEPPVDKYEPNSPTPFFGSRYYIPTCRHCSSAISEISISLLTYIRANKLYHT